MWHRSNRILIFVTITKNNVSDLPVYLLFCPIRNTASGIRPRAVRGIITLPAPAQQAVCIHMHTYWRSKMSKNQIGLQYDAVKEACDQLRVDGLKPSDISLRDILNITKTGSLGTISKHYNLWLAEQQATSAMTINLAPEDLADLGATVARLVDRKWRHAREELEKTIDNYRAQVEHLQDDRNAIAEQNADMEKAELELQERMAALQGEIIAANKRADELARANEDCRHAYREASERAATLQRHLQARERSPVEQEAYDRATEALRSGASPSDDLQSEGG